MDYRRVTSFAAMVWAVAAPAPAAAAPDGYFCSADALTNIGGLEGVGVGEVTLRADPQYRSTGAEFIYHVRDQSPFGVGHNRISATWNLTGERAEGLSATQVIWLPLRGPLFSPPVSIAISLDEGPPVTIPIPDSWLRKDAFGVPLALRVPPEAAPRLRGRRSFGYKLKARNGTDLRSDLLLMPDWKKVPRQIDAALGRARGMLREKTKCGSFFGITTSGG